MPNNQLVDQVLNLAANAAPTERVVLKLAAALIKQIDPEYSVFDDTDERIKLPAEEWDWLPGTLEILNGIPSPKDWEIPEWSEAADPEEREEADR
jgi:hypothetical protein